MRNNPYNTTKSYLAFLQRVLELPIVKRKIYKRQFLAAPLSNSNSYRL